MLSLEMRALMTNRDKWEEDMRNLPIGERMMMLVNLNDDMLIRAFNDAHRTTVEDERTLDITCEKAMCNLATEFNVSAYFGTRVFFMNREPYPYFEEFTSIPKVPAKDITYEVYARTIVPIIMRQFNEVLNKFKNP